eukprot:TRINITY_DN2052_c0_g1_i5.p1 TRINITY_DN2052_c0_g1~~TRINITY_DN2052_c0_g1_i5.p1  ORF type:complete len:436 (-),score=129.04 TRINITY_DN2052_c0_g1_i5:142-1449(-)
MERAAPIHRSNSAPSKSGPSGEDGSLPLRSTSQGTSHSGHQLLTTGWASDFELRVNQRVYHLHRFVLEQGCSYFARIIRGASEDKPGMIRHQMKPRTDISHVERAIRLLYTKDFRTELRNIEDAIGLLLLSHEWRFEEATDECVAFLKENATFADLASLEAIAAKDPSFTNILTALIATSSTTETLADKYDGLRKRVMRTLFLIRKEPHSLETQRMLETCETEFSRNRSRGCNDLVTKILTATLHPSCLLLSRDNIPLSSSSSVDIHPGIVWLGSQAKLYCSGPLLFRIVSRFADHPALSSTLADLIPSSPRHALSSSSSSLSSSLVTTPELNTIGDLAKSVFLLAPSMIRSGEIDADQIVQLLLWARRRVLTEGEFDLYLADLVRNMRVSDHQYFFDMCLSGIEKLPEQTLALVTLLKHKYRTYSESDIIDFEI